MTCTMCGYRYRLQDALSSCSRCTLGKVFSSCGLAKCPNCGYEMPREAADTDDRIDARQTRIRRKRHDRKVRRT